MRIRDIFTTAIANTLRTKLRTFLTVIAVGVGAFTLTLTSGIGAGINKYIDAQVEAMGDANQVYVMPAQTTDASMGFSASEPNEYDPDAETTSAELETPALDDDDIESHEDLNHVEMVEAMEYDSIEYLEVSEDDQYSLPSAGFPSEQTVVEYSAGGPASDADDACELMI